MKPVKINSSDSNMRFISIFVFIFLNLFLVTNVFAAPSITKVFSTISSSSKMRVSGIDFGTKTQPAPVYWNNLETEIVSSNLPGWTVKNNPGGIVSTNDKWAGNKSLYFAMKSSNPSPGWNQILRDMGASDKWYFHFKVRLNKNDSNTQFQWKSWRISSSPDGYAWNTEASTTVMTNDLWWRSSTGWFNVGPGVYWNNGGTSAVSIQDSAHPTEVLLNQWQTLEQYIQMSSVPLRADGISRFWRNGELVLSKTDYITHDAGSGLWRYMLLGQAIVNNVPDYNTMDTDIYYDDIYIDNTQARVMICDTNSPTWPTRSNCEIQIPVAWADDRIDFTLNPGRFIAGQVLYVYVINSNGVVNSDGFSYSIGAPPPIAAPKSVTVVPVVPTVPVK